MQIEGRSAWNCRLSYLNQCVTPAAKANTARFKDHERSIFRFTLKHACRVILVCHPHIANTSNGLKNMFAEDKTCAIYSASS
jgi:hypothetical protein